MIAIPTVPISGLIYIDMVKNYFQEERLGVTLKMK
jgi:hypothetical protein